MAFCNYHGWSHQENKAEEGPQLSLQGIQAQCRATQRPRRLCPPTRSLPYYLGDLDRATDNRGSSDSSGLNGCSGNLHGGSAEWVAAGIPCFVTVPRVAGHSSPRRRERRHVGVCYGCFLDHVAQFTEDAADAFSLMLSQHTAASEGAVSACCNAMPSATKRCAMRRDSCPYRKTGKHVDSATSPPPSAAPKDREARACERSRHTCRHHNPAYGRFVRELHGDSGGSPRARGAYVEVDHGRSRKEAIARLHAHDENQFKTRHSSGLTNQRVTVFECITHANCGRRGRVVATESATRFAVEFTGTHSTEFSMLVRQGINPSIRDEVDLLLVGGMEHPHTSRSST
ncbi:hypothetical protein SPRG_05538 [Saprolegnia parasitica CBS 223.65]|uniref:Uncharacterized protein n=1 Tax=Saprolegnia parasitica (strain CBS 223.65) TaxID=695850 RepID=A0A067CS07_SAPPC|nr:hypothetical protein SPRG_05538 [Saprolegnia parasitica CBS 223.65]KDO29582.1 hypothetical protein SPRG_05538 [Saprolegnia parasitica CBS 223.65]|eukprot:XP_012199646.1 hypothetical protein SPRG_05538 [Saprolegnia parasitica CBS 223.65]